MHIPSSNFSCHAARSLSLTLGCFVLNLIPPVFDLLTVGFFLEATLMVASSSVQIGGQ